MAEVEELRGFWASCPSHRDADIDFFLADCTRMGALRPHVIVLTRGGQPAVLLVGRLEKKRLDLGLAILTSRMPRLKTLTFIHGGLIGQVSASDCECLVNSIMASLHTREATAAFCDRYSVDETFYKCATSLPGRFFLDRTPFVTPAFAIKWQGGGKSFVSTLSKHARYNFRRRLRMLESAFNNNVRIECLQAEADVERLLKDAEAIARSSYLRGMGRGFTYSEAMRQRLYAEARKNSLRGYLLYLEDKPCAFWIGSFYCGVLFSDMMAYKPEHARYSPGMHLIMSVLAEILDDCGPGKEVGVDFGSGDQEYKINLSNHRWSEASFIIAAPTLWGFLINGLRTPVLLLTRLIKKASRQSSLVVRLRRAFAYYKTRQLTSTTDE